MRRASRTDSTHRSLIDFAKQLGCEFIETFRLGDDAPDAIGYHRYPGVFLVEIKAPKGRLTPGQTKLQRRIPVHVWRTKDDVCRTLGFIA